MKIQRIRFSPGEYDVLNESLVISRDAFCLRDTRVALLHLLGECIVIFV